MKKIAASDVPRTALVTGGTSGVGLSIVQALAASGVYVHFVGTQREKGERIEAELNAAGIRQVNFIQLDLGRLDSVQAFADRFLGEAERLDVLVNVAGILLPKREVTEAGIEKTLAVDHLSAYVLSQALRSSLGKAPHGRIVNVSGPSAQVLKPQLDFQNLQLEKGYSFSRAVVNALHAKTVMTEILADRFKGEGIDVIAFDPGAVRTDIGRGLAWPLKLGLGLTQLFMSKTSPAGIYASTSTDLTGVTGQFIVGTKARALDFDAGYKARLLAATDDMLSRALSSRPAA